jgi:uncharacterized membrane protein YphA (DoxX/SURF4 family)
MSQTWDLAPYALGLCRVVIGLTFLLSAVSKLRDRRAFHGVVERFDLLPVRWVNTASDGFIVAELIVASLVIVGGPALVPGFLLSVALLIVFSAALVIALHRGQALSCNCFGASDRPLSRIDVARNFILISFGLFGVWTVSLSQQDVAGGEAALILLMGASLVALLTNLDDVVRTLHRPFTPVDV